MVKMRNMRELWVKKTLVGLGLGQFLSLLITSTGFSSSELAKKGSQFSLCFSYSVFVNVIRMLLHIVVHANITE